MGSGRDFRRAKFFTTSRARPARKERDTQTRPPPATKGLPTADMLERRTLLRQNQELRSDAEALLMCLSYTARSDIKDLRAAVKERRLGFSDERLFTLLKHLHDTGKVHSDGQGKDATWTRR